MSEPQRTEQRWGKPFNATWFIPVRDGQDYPALFKHFDGVYRPAPVGYVYDAERCGWTHPLFQNACAAVSDRPETTEEHDWRSPAPGEALEEGGFCRRCGRPASEAGLPCSDHVEVNSGLKIRVPG